MDVRDPLSRLVVDHAALNRELLAKVLEPWVTLDPERATFAFRYGMRSHLTAAHTILVALLAQKALVLLGADCEEPSEPRDLGTRTGVAGGTLRPALKRLADSGLVIKRDGGYIVPNHSIEDIADQIAVGGGAA